jgi:uncharacterized lipoprotein YajG
MHRPTLALFLAAVLLGGCATGRTIITLPAAAGTAASTSVAGPVVVVTSVVDERIFEDVPSDPSTPSLGELPASKTPADVKARAVARKRHGYGGALGDVVLGEPDTVRLVVKRTVETSLREAGYAVVQPGAPASGAASKVEVRVSQFWLWLQPGVMVGTVRSRIVAELRIEGRAPLHVEAETSQRGQVFSQEGWTTAVSIAITAFQDACVQRLRQAVDDKASLRARSTP